MAQKEIFMMAFCIVILIQNLLIHGINEQNLYVEFCLKF